MSDPLADLLPASFKGIPFHLETARDKTENALDPRLFPRSDTVVVDELGQGLRQIRVEAYVATFTGLPTEVEALRLHFLSPGAGVLVLPAQGIIPSVKCQSCETAFERSRLGFVAFSLEFVEERAGAAAPPLGALEVQVGVAAGLLASALTQRLRNLKSGGSRHVSDAIKSGLVTFSTNAAALAAQAEPDVANALSRVARAGSADDPGSTLAALSAAAESLAFSEQPAALGLAESIALPSS